MSPAGKRRKALGSSGGRAARQHCRLDRENMKHAINTQTQQKRNLDKYLTQTINLTSWMSSAKRLINLLNSRCYCLRVKMYSTVMNRGMRHFTFLWLTKKLLVEVSIS